MVYVHGYQYHWHFQLCNYIVQLQCDVNYILAFKTVYH